MDDLLVPSGFAVGLLVGSIPGLYLGTRWASRLRDGVLRPVIAAFLLALGLGFSLKELM